MQKYIYLRESPGWTSVQLMPGTYYLVVQLKPSYPVPSGDPDGPLGFYVEGKPRATGEDFFYPADLGAFSEDFSRTVDMEHFTDFELDYRLTGDYDIDAFRHDVVHRFTLSEPMEVTLDNCGSGHGLGNPYNYQRSVVLSSSLDTVPPASTKSGCYYPDGIKEYVLSPGTYYVYSWGEYLSMDYNFTVNLAGTVIEEGSSPLRPADAGNRDADFAFSDTLAFSPGCWRLTLSVPMELEITGGAGLSVRTEGGSVLHESEPGETSLHVAALMPGAYLVVAGGGTGGETAIRMEGKSLGEPGGQLLTAIDAGTHAGGFFFTDTRNTAEGYTDSYGGAANDVFYRFALADSARVIAHNGGSGLEDTRLTLLASDGESVLYSTNGTGQARIEAELPAGAYYLVAEGATSNGILVTTIEARGEAGSLSTTDGQPHVVTIVPLVKSADASALGTGEARQEVQYFDSFGNPVVKARHGFSSRGNDLYVLQGYDGLNRPEKEWLPVPLAGTNGMYVSPAELERAARASSLYGEDEHPCSRTVYDGSALDEVVEEYGPGADWHDAGRSVKTDRMTNFSAEDAETAYLSPVEPPTWWPSCTPCKATRSCARGLTRPAR